MEIQAEFRAKVRKRRSEERSARHRLMTADGELFQTLLESLILAQDERWRRA